MSKDFEQISKNSGFMKNNGGLFFKEISKIEFEFKTTITEKHLNSKGITHGGFISAIIDSGAGTAVYRSSNCSICVTVSLDIKFISPTKLGDEILGFVKILKKTKTMLFVICHLKSNGKIIASASGIWKIVKQ